MAECLSLLNGAVTRVIGGLSGSELEEAKVELEAKRMAKRIYAIDIKEDPAVHEKRVCASRIEEQSMAVFKEFSTFVHDALSPFPEIQGAVVAKMGMMFNESVRNAITYGSRPDQHVSISWTIHKSVLSLLVENPVLDPPFDPKQIGVSDLQAARGRGLEMMRGMSDRFEYNDTGNQVLIEQNLETKSSRWRNLMRGVLSYLARLSGRP